MEIPGKSQPELPPPASVSGLRMSDSGLASSSTACHYPPRLHKEGKSPIQNHSINHYSAMANLAKVKEELGDEVWSHLKNSSIGVFAKFADLKYTWAAKRVHYFLVNQLRVDDVHEIWSLIDDQLVRFSLHEFAVLTGLNCDPVKASDVCTISHEEFWREMGISTATGPTYEELLDVMAKSHLWHFDKRVMVAQLCFLSVAVLGIHKGSRIPLETAKMVLNKVVFEKHPWGRVSFEKLISSIKILQMKDKSYTLQGPVQVLLTWVYEHVVGLGESYGSRKVKENEEDPDEVPHLNWLSGRNRISFEEFISNEKAAHGKVRVKHLVNVPMWDMFPIWSKGEKIDPLVRNLIEDLMTGKLRANAWSEDGKKKKRKADKEDELVDDVETSNKKKKPKGKEHVEGPKDSVVDMVGMYKMVEKLSSTVEEMKVMMTDMGKRVAANERNAEQEEEFATMFSVMKKFFQNVENKPKNAQAKDDVHSARQSCHEASSASPSWMVEVNQTSNNDFPSTRVVKRGKENNGEKKEKRVERTEKKEKKSQKESQNILEKKVVVKVENVFEDAKKKVEESKSEETIWSNPREREAHKLVGNAIDNLLHIATNLDGATSKPRRDIKLAGSKKNPFIGNSTVKRIIKGIDVSPAQYDPLEVVDEFLHEKLQEFMKTDEEVPLQTKDSKRRFYLAIITPRSEWIRGDYGWLATGHIAVAMSMFRNRHMRDPSPFFSQRISFLDAFFVSNMVRDYKDYLADRKSFQFKKPYRDHFSGIEPLVTNKRWLIDIDHLYACLFVLGNHWVALDIDLKRNIIFIYDSIPPKDDTLLLGDVRPIRKMIPAILSEYIPDSQRKKSCAMMEVRRVLNNVPINENPGDCGVYSLKYIECLALGLTFEGLSDTNIQAVRVKLASEIFDEIHNEVEELWDEDVRRKDIPHLIDEDVIDDKEV